MRQVRLRIADALHDRELPAARERHQRLQRGMQRDALVELDHRFAFDADVFAQHEVRRIGERDHGVKTVVAAFQRRTVDPGRAARPSFDVRRIEQVVAERAYLRGERRRVVVADSECAQRADHELDRRLHQHPAIAIAPERIAEKRARVASPRCHNRSRETAWRSARRVPGPACRRCDADPASMRCARRALGSARIQSGGRDIASRRARE
ncbi:hypothetical protein OKW37_002638 [Paraburkholderia sp. MM5482-R2]